MTDKIPEDLRWLAENLSEWKRSIVGNYCTVSVIEINGKKKPLFFPGYEGRFNQSDWQAARQQIEEERMDIIGRNGNGGEHYDSVMTPEEQEEYGPKPRSKYHVEIRPGVWVDVYDVLHAFRVTNPGDQHALKKLLKPGQRGHKDANQDRREAVDSILRAIELEGGSDD